MVEAGDMLFPYSEIPEEEEEYLLLKARFIFDIIKNHLYYDALNVGLYDLSAGIDLIIEGRTFYSLPFISASLVRTDTGEPIFEPYLIKDV
ncbi:MAG: hypothetical protein SV062_06660, partial [Thermodesulfobacteriota bacterium]|nr:hypothetical protein [Thermodesulfobacteriota bacterium]